MSGYKLTENVWQAIKRSVTYYNPSYLIHTHYSHTQNFTIMEFIFSFHVKTQQREDLLQLLHDCTGIANAQQVRYADDLLEQVLADRNAYPDYLAVGRNSPEWFTVECNSFKKLHDWGELLSRQLNALFLQIVSSCVDEYAYLLVYRNGELIREIENRHFAEQPLMNWGKPFDFEGEALTMFDLDSLMDFCTYLGIDTINGQKETYITVLKNTKGRQCGVMYNIQREMVKAYNEIVTKTKIDP